jgi:hypothetical protein
MCANCGMHTRSSKLVIWCLPSRNVGMRRGGSSLPDRHFCVCAKKETDLISNVDRVEKWNVRDPSNRGNSQGGQAPKVHVCVLFVAPRRVICGDVLGVMVKYGIYES